MTVQVISQNIVELVLNGGYPLMIEEGNPLTDMRRWLLGPNSKGRRPIWGSASKRAGSSVGSGWYNVIPFKHKGMSTPQKGLGSLKAITGTLQKKGISEDRANDLAKIIKKAVKEQLMGEKRTEVFTNKKGKTKIRQLGPSIQTTKKRVKWGGRLRLTDDKGMGRNKNMMKSMYEGMVRSQKIYEKKGGSQFVTFRTISSRKGQGVTWMYPARSGEKLMDEVAKYIEKHSGEFLEEVFRRMTE